MIKQKKRNEIDDKYKWDLTTIFKSDNDFLNELDNCKNLSDNILVYKGHILDSADSLYNYLQTNDNNERKLAKLSFYASLKHDEDTTNIKYQEYYQKVQLLIKTYSENTSFVVPEMMEKDYDYIKSLICKDKRLKIYEHNLEDLYRYKEQDRKSVV